MSFHLNRRTEFLNRLVTADLPTIVGTAAPYGVRLEQNAGVAGQIYWRVVGIHHLTPDENRGRHAVYVDVIDEAGQRVHNPNLRLRWGWEGQRADEPVDPKPFDKPDDEPAANADLNRGQHLWVQIEGDGLPSERVLNCHTEHVDEPGPGGEKWNTTGHHSFYILFQRTRRQGEVQKPDIITEPCITVKEAREKRVELEKTIVSLLAKFSNETGARVHSIDVAIDYENGRRDDFYSIIVQVFI